MKQVTNKLTGEVYEIPDNDCVKYSVPKFDVNKKPFLVKEELIKKEMLPLIPDEILEKYYQIQALQNEIENWQYQIKDKVKEIFKKYNIKSFKNDYIELTYIAPTKRKSVDTQKLKEAGLYDEFSKETDVKEGLRVKIL